MGKKGHNCYAIRLLAARQSFHLAPFWAALFIWLIAQCLDISRMNHEELLNYKVTRVPSILLAGYHTLRDT
jgi:hypothetical protein